MVKNTNSASSRRAKLIALIQSGAIHSQSDVVSELKRAGFKVTQATASRDLEDIGALRGRNDEGEMTYKLPESGSVVKVENSPNLILTIEASANLAVVKTPPGGAQLLASNIDRSGSKSIIGTIAGDDTVLVIARKANGGAEVAKELLNSANSKSRIGRSSKKRGR